MLQANYQINFIDKKKQDDAPALALKTIEFLQQFQKELGLTNT